MSESAGPFCGSCPDCLDKTHWLLRRALGERVLRVRRPVFAVAAPKPTRTGFPFRAPFVSAEAYPSGSLAA